MRFWERVRLAARVLFEERSPSDLLNSAALASLGAWDRDVSAERCAHGVAVQLWCTECGKVPIADEERKRCVILESPYAGDVERNVAYARACLRDSLLRGEAPIASHLLYTQPGVLDDEKPEERQIGIDAGLAWGHEADVTVVCIDRGISRGMKSGINRALREGRPVEFRHVKGGDA